jgi:hypothetical protein
MRLIQHITHHQARDTLIGRYMDTMGQEATYTWMLEGQIIRVSSDEEDSDTYFQATLNEDHSQYIGTWHYPDGGASEVADKIIYTRVQDNG